MPVDAARDPSRLSFAHVVQSLCARKGCEAGLTRAVDHKRRVPSSATGKPLLPGGPLPLLIVLIVLLLVLLLVLLFVLLLSSPPLSSYAGGRFWPCGGGVTAAGNTVTEPMSSVEESTAAAFMSHFMPQFTSPFCEPEASPDEDAAVETRELAPRGPFGGGLGAAGTAHSDIANNPGSGAVDSALLAKRYRSGGVGAGVGTGAGAAASAKDPVDKDAATGAPEGGAPLSCAFGRRCGGGGSPLPLLPLLLPGVSTAPAASSWSIEPLPDRLR